MKAIDWKGTGNTRGPTQIGVTSVESFMKTKDVLQTQRAAIGLIVIQPLDLPIALALFRKDIFQRAEIAGVITHC